MFVYNFGGGGKGRKPFPLRKTPPNPHPQSLTGGVGGEFEGRAGDPRPPALPPIHPFLKYSTLAAARAGMVNAAGSIRGVRPYSFSVAVVMGPMEATAARAASF